MALIIHAFETGPVATIGYLVLDDATRDAVIIDAPLDSAEPIAQAAAKEGVTPAALLLTHTHWDHTGDAAKLRRLYPGMKIYVHASDEYRLTDPAKHTVWKLPFEIEDEVADGYLKEGEMFRQGALEFEILHTPGHTEGGVCLLNREHKVVFAGDTLFAGSVGRTDLPGGDWETLSASIARELLNLPDDIRVLPGHGPETTIGEERQSNPFLS